MSDPGKLVARPWVVVANDGLYYIGLHESEADAWRVSLGWPDEEEIVAKKAIGWYAAPATATWREPSTTDEQPAMT